MRKPVAGLTVLVFCCGFLAGCGGSADDVGEGEHAAKAAANIQDRAKKYDPMQMKCPVCGERPIKGEFYHDVDQRRVYFDKEECVQKFKQNTQQYIQKLEQMKRDRMRMSPEEDLSPASSQ